MYCDVSKMYYILMCLSFIDVLDKMYCDVFEMYFMCLSFIDVFNVFEFY